MDLNTLLLPNHLSVFSLGAYLGPDFTDEERSNAGTRGESLCIHFGIIPSEFDIPQCHCGRPMYRLSDYTRKLRYRFKCSVGHRISPTKNTFLEYVHTAGELGAHKIVQMAYLWTMKANTSTIQQEVKVSKETALAFCEYFRDVATKIANHDYTLIGDSQDIVEVDETHLFKAKYNVGRAMTWNAVWLFGILKCLT
ncbi:uncharacterized protein LOC126552680 [Aphis gossypii]|uniref:uncharacterized protein LOC126552680 n=1 Tax=Aphis gossypii TaxID=80765 RepID=UPI002158BCC5|nr:uncharacterized protein LOC126552680 [Aphis gossypii]